MTTPPGNRLKHTRTLPVPRQIIRLTRMLTALWPSPGRLPEEGTHAPARGFNGAGRERM